MRNIIRLTKPAQSWDEGLPLGNGKMGAMIMGKTDEETIILNEETLWYGADRNRRNPDSKTHIDKIRTLLLEGEVQKAQFLARMSMTSTPKYVNPYQPAGDMRLCFCKHKGVVEDYERWLDLDHAIAYVSYKMGGATYHREHFISQKYQVLAVKLVCSRAAGLTMSVNISRKPFEEYTEKLDANTVCNYGQAGPSGISYFTGARLSSPTGTVNTMGDFCYVENADEIYIYLSCGTDFQDKSFKESCVDRLNLAERIGYEQLKKEHLELYHSLYQRMSFTLNDCETDLTPVDQALEKMRHHNDKRNDYLTVTLFNYARYLMISSSYKCVLPSNLQGIWNGEFIPPWQSEFTININTQMNYWMAEKCNLAECHLPLFDLLDRVVVNGRKTAKEIYGCRGFCAHHNTNIWANTDTEGIFDSSPFWPMGGAWLSLHLYQHYLYTQDTEFLKSRALPVMREAIEFFEDYLFEMPDGTLVTGPSLSPENVYRSKTGDEGALCMGPTMDSQILRQLCTSYIEGVRQSGTIEDTSIVETILNRLPPTRISADGRIMEWLEEVEEVEPGHRHISHLYGLYPSNEISEASPDLFKASKKTLECRLQNGGGHSGWSRAWITCFYARLKEGDKVLEGINDLLKQSTKINMLNDHPPFQIDGSFGIADAITEALIQSNNGYVDILPALPHAWKKGELKGVCMQKGMVGNLVWEDGLLKSFRVTSRMDQEVEFRYSGRVVYVQLVRQVEVEICGIMGI